MVTNTNIGTASVANILSALQTLGFTVDTTNSTAKWGSDTNDKLYFKVNISGTQTLLQLYNSSNTVVGYGITFTTASEYKMTYDNIGNSVVFGFALASATGNMIQFIIAEPIDTGDSWLYSMPYVGNSATAKNLIIDGATELSINYGTNQLYSGSANGFQVCKYYDGTRFCGNLFLTSVCENIVALSNATATPTDNNYREGAIGTDSYLIVNQLNNAANTKVAIKRVVTA